MQIKFNPMVYFETASVSLGANSLNNGYKKSSKGDVSGLPTITEYLNKEKEIRTLIDSYSKLVLKDIKTVNSMMREADNLDQKMQQAIASASSVIAGTISS